MKDNGAHSFTEGHEMKSDNGKEPVFKCTFRGSYLVSANLSDILATLEYEAEDMEQGERIVITRMLMTQKRYESLPDFDGF